MAARTRLPLLFPKNLPPFRNQRLTHTGAAVKEPAYPPIIPSLTAKSKSARGRQVDEQVQKICASSVEEKLSLITRIQRMKFVVYPQTFARNADTWYQHFTKTAYIPGLPEKYTLSPERETGGEEEQPAAAQTTVPGVGHDGFTDIRSLVTRVILQEHWQLRNRTPFLYRKQEQTVGPFLRNLVTGLTFSMAKYNPLFLSSSLDIDPNVHFYWRRGQTIIPKGHRRGRQEPTRFQIDDRPNSQIRITEQLPQDSYAAEVQEVTLSPSVMPLFRRQYDNNMFTGAKLPDPACYGHTQFHLVPDRYHRDRMARLQQSDQVEVFLRANALTSLFAWTGAQAMYQGFWNHEDVTRPFVSQAVITDGKFFSFFCYQLNTVALAVETDANNPRKNLLWGTESLRLYDSVQDGEVVGLNDDVLKLLVQFLMNKQ
ncbi:28S ribosomal protein S30 mitochondrial [Dissostichus eleginoides]|uniref:28S ribosomal protein S30 mitochondrial n=1 Tax=Dissostichus eleginoides TaxID=100907 RepID=A0AAD9BYD8_DISEL|nr:28S ribosomal protein S30 mitochondrial [Dissostichus eleginoides]